MALKAVSNAPSSSSAGSSAGPAALLGGASGSTPGSGGAANAVGAGDSAGSTGPAGTAGTAGSRAAGAGGCNFLQMLTQSASASGGAKVDAKPADTPAKAADENDAASDSDPVAAALAMLSQSMAPPQATNSVATGKADAKVDSSNGDATGSTGAIGATSLGSASQASSATDGLSMQNLVSLLAQEADSDPEPAHRTDSAQTDASSPTSSSTASTDNGSTSSTTAPNPHMSVGSHFGVQHTAADSQTTDVKSPLGTAAWADELGGKITWMAHQGIESASLRLSPEHLGPVEVRISVQDGATSVMFGAAQADTRSALEQALPRLREMFATQGLTLTDAGVSREPPKQQSRPTPVAAIAAVSGVSDDGTSVSSAMRLRLGLLDTYA